VTNAAYWRMPKELGRGSVEQMKGALQQDAFSPGHDPMYRTSAFFGQSLRLCKSFWTSTKFFYI